MFGSSAACAEALAATGAEELFSFFFLFGAALGRSLWTTRTTAERTNPLHSGAFVARVPLPMHALRSGSAVKRVQSLKTEFLFPTALSLTGAACQDEFGRVVRAIEGGESLTNHIVR
jgi:hypothetical protein